jgi:hypothetical protein
MVLLMLFLNGVDKNYVTNKWIMRKYFLKENLKIMGA